MSQASSGSLSGKETRKAGDSPCGVNGLCLTDESESARGRRGAEPEFGADAGNGNEAEGDSGEGGWRTTDVTDRRTFFGGGVGGVATQVGSTRKSRWSGAESGAENSLGVEGIISPVVIVVVGVHTGDALIGGMGRKPEMVRRWSVDGEGNLRSRIPGSMRAREENGRDKRLGRPDACQAGL